MSADMETQDTEMVTETENGVENNGAGQTEESGENGASEQTTTESTVPKDDRKLFVGALNYLSTEADLKEYFSKFGEVENVDVKIDQNTGKSKGFAFITFASADAIDQVVAVEEHTIGGKKVAASKAKAKQGKIFVGGLKPELTNEEIMKYFSAYGKVLELQSPFDKTKNQRKNFCFITFEQESVAKTLMKTTNHTIEGHEVEVKKHTPKTDNMMMFGGMRGAPRGGRGAPRGVRGGPRGGRGGRGGYGGQDMYGGYGGGYAGGYDGGYGGYDYGSGYGGYGGGYGGGYENYDYSGYGAQSYGGGKAPRGVKKTRAQPY